MNTNAIIAQACHNAANARLIAARAGVDVQARCADAFRAGKKAGCADLMEAAEMAYMMARVVAEKARAIRAGKGNVEYMRKGLPALAESAAYAAGRAAAF